MKYTNKLGLPDPLFQALNRDSTYEQKSNEIRVTELIGPPRVAVLKKLHEGELEADVADMLWLTLGKAFHHIMEQGESRWHIITEHRLRLDLPNDYILTGAPDSFDITMFEENEGLIDYKLTTAWKIKIGDFADWTSQLNIYRYMLERGGLRIPKVAVWTCLRDWSKLEARRNPEYPQKQMVKIDLPLWAPEQTIDFILARFQLHRAAREGELPLCTDEERWTKKESWVIRKEGVKKAVKVEPSKKDASLYAFNKNLGDSEGNLKNGYYYEHRKPERTRCLNYCIAADFCTQWQEDASNPVNII